MTKRKDKGTDPKSGRDATTDKLADHWLGKRRKQRLNKRDTLTREGERLMFTAYGTVPEDGFKFYDPDDDLGLWLTGGKTVYVSPDAIDLVEPSLCAEADDGNTRARNLAREERRLAMRHTGDSDSGGPTKEKLPILGDQRDIKGRRQDEAPRKLCKQCDRLKGVALFTRKSDAKDGLHPYCNRCRKETVSQKRTATS